MTTLIISFTLLVATAATSITNLTDAAITTQTKPDIILRPPPSLDGQSPEEEQDDGRPVRGDETTEDEPEEPELPPPQLEEPTSKEPKGQSPKAPGTGGNAPAPQLTHVYVGWLQFFQGNEKLVLKKSTDGNTFGPATTISSTTGVIASSTNYDIQGGYDMFVDSSKNIYVVYQVDGGGGAKLYLKKSTDGGNTFGPAATIASKKYHVNEIDYFEPSIVVDTSKNVYVAWDENSKGILLKKSTDGGNTFGPEINISNDPKSIFPDMAIDSSNNIYVVWVKQGVFYLKKSTDGGNTFGSETTVGSGYEEELHVNVYLNNVYVSWRTEIQGQDEIYLKKSTDGGNTFGPEINISNTPKNSYNHDVAVSGNDVYLTWREDAPADKGLRLLIKKSTDGGNTFQPFANIYWESPSDSDSVIPRMALVSGASISEPASTLYVVWSFGDMLFKKSINGGNTFTPPNAIDLNSDLQGWASYRPMIAAR